MTCDTRLRTDHPCQSINITCVRRLHSCQYLMEICSVYSVLFSTMTHVQMDEAGFLCYQCQGKFSSLFQAEQKCRARQMKFGWWSERLVTDLDWLQPMIKGNRCAPAVCRSCLGYQKLSFALQTSFKVVWKNCTGVRRQTSLP